jgi:arylsulfatase A-like enzyme
MKMFFRGVLVGGVYSLVFPLLGGWLTLYVPLFALLHSLLLGFVVGASVWLIERFLSRIFMKRLTLSVVLLSHFLFWLFLINPIFKNVTLTELLVVFLGTLGVITLSWWLFRCGRKLPFQTILVSIVLITLFLGEWLILTSIPAGVFKGMGFQKIPERNSIITQFLYPTSLPIEDAISRYGYLLTVNSPDKFISVTVLDALRKDFVGREMYGLELTQSIDSLAKDGLKISNYFVQGSWTKPSTASLFTGMYLHDHGTCIVTEKYGQKLSKRYLTLAERLDQRDYRTIGTAFVSHLNRRFHFDQGFDNWLAPDTGFVSDIGALRLTLFRLVRNKSDKVFIYNHLQGPHSPYKKALFNEYFWEHSPYYKEGKLHLKAWGLPAPSNLTRGTLTNWQKKTKRPISPDEVKFIRALYGAQLNYYDRLYIKKYVDSLKKLGLYKDSFIALTGDHGQQLFDNYRKGQTKFSHYHNLHPTTINPPLIIKPPRTGFSEIHGEPLESTFFESIDLTATILDFTNASQFEIKGDSFLNLLKNRDQFGGDFTYALSERCGIKGKDQRIDFATMSPSELRQKLVIREFAYPTKSGLLRYDFVNKQALLYKNTSAGFWKMKSSGTNNDILGGIFRKYNSTIGGDSIFQRIPGEIVPLKSNSIKNLKGLGYVN